MGRILAIDYGDVRVGLAVSDELGITAQGLPTLTINNNQKLFLENISNIVKEYNISQIVIGYPKNMDGSISKTAEKIDKLLPKLKNIVEIVNKWDERLSTVASYNIMRELNIKQKDKNKHADKLAAVYILQGYMQKLEK